jgi:hypothetical protein
MRRTFPFFAPLLVLLACTLTARAAGKVQLVKHTTTHYQLAVEAEVADDAEDYGKLIEALHGKLTRFFGRAPDQPLRVEIYADKLSYEFALHAANEPIEGGSGLYSPAQKTVWLHVQPSRQYTQHLLLHECTHQFQCLAVTDNEPCSAEWFTEAIADYFGMHSWDGETLRVGIVPAVSLEDFPAQAKKEWNSLDWDLAAVASDELAVSRPGGWALCHFLIHYDFDRFEQFAARLNRKQNPAIAFNDVYGEQPRLGPQFVSWVAKHQQPLTPVWVNWRMYGPWIEGESPTTALCIFKKKLSDMTVEARPTDACHNAGVVFGYKDGGNYSVAQLSRNRTVRIVRCQDQQWGLLEALKAPFTQGEDTFTIKRVGKNELTVSLNGVQILQTNAAGRLGLSAHNGRAQFRVLRPKLSEPFGLGRLLAGDTPADRSELVMADNEPNSNEPEEGQPPEDDPESPVDAPDSEDPQPLPRDLNALDGQGRAALHRAVLDGDAKLAGRLIDAGAKIDVVMPNGVTPLMVAAHVKNADLAELLLSAGADPRIATPRGSTALHYAAVSGSEPIAQLLLERDIEVDAQKPGGTTPLILACQFGHQDIAALLIDAEADVDTQLKSGLTGLMLAAQNGHLNVVVLMTEAGANTSLEDEEGRTATDFAEQMGHDAIARLLAK